MNTATGICVGVTLIFAACTIVFLVIAETDSDDE